jgi:lipase
MLDPALWVPSDEAENAARRELSRGPWASVEEALDARAETVERAPRELLEEEMHEHLVEQPDGTWFYRYSRDVVAEAYREMAKPPAPWESLRVPTVLVVADHGKLVSAAELVHYRDALGDLLKVTVVPGGHIVLWDAYPETSAAIAEFLS